MLSSKAIREACDEITLWQPFPDCLPSSLSALVSLDEPPPSTWPIAGDHCACQQGGEPPHQAYPAFEISHLKIYICECLDVRLPAMLPSKALKNILLPSLNKMKGILTLKMEVACSLEEQAFGKTPFVLWKIDDVVLGFSPFHPTLMRTFQGLWWAAFVLLKLQPGAWRWGAMETLKATAAQGSVTDGHFHKQSWPQ